MSDDRRIDGRAFLTFPLQDQVPTELREVLCDFVWDSAKLQRLPLPVGTATVDGLRWHLDLPYWRHDGKPFQVTPSQVSADPVRFREHYERTMAADLDCPLDLLFRNGRWVILDGVHRLLKADLLGLDNVRVRRLSAAMLPSSSRRRPDLRPGSPLPRTLQALANEARVDLDGPYPSAELVPPRAGARQVVLTHPAMPSPCHSEHDATGLCPDR